MVTHKKITEKDLPPFFQKKIKDLDKLPNADGPLGKEAMKRIYIDAYAVAEHCGNLLRLGFFACKNPQKQAELVPQLDDSVYTTWAFDMVISNAREYLAKKPIEKIRGLFTRGANPSTHS